MKTAAVVPINALASAKSRLAAYMTEADRHALILWMAGGVLAALRASGVVESIAVVSPDAKVLRWAREHRAHPLHQHHGDLNAGLELGRRWATEQHADALLILLADLPCLAPDEVAAFVQRSATHPLVLAPDRQQQGTNGLLLHLSGSPLPAAYSRGTGDGLKSADSLAARVSGFSQSGSCAGSSEPRGSEGPMMASSGSPLPRTGTADARPKDEKHVLDVRRRRRSAAEGLGVGAIPFAFGAGSLARHLALARERSVEPELFLAPGLRFDVDTPADLAMLYEYGIWMPEDHDDYPAYRDYPAHPVGAGAGGASDKGNGAIWL